MNVRLEIKISCKYLEFIPKIVSNPDFIFREKDSLRKSACHGILLERSESKSSIFDLYGF